MLQCKISIHPISVEHATLEQTDNSKHVPDSKEPKCIWYEDYEQKGDRSSHSYPSCLSLSLSLSLNRPSCVIFFMLLCLPSLLPMSLLKKTHVLQVINMISMVNAEESCKTFN